MDQLLKLQSQLPEFWSNQLEEESAMQSLLLAYSYVYGSAKTKWQTIKNELSPFTTDAYKTDYYKVIDLRQTITPTNPVNGALYFELPLNTFQIDIISKSINFTTPLPFGIIYDTVLKKTLLEMQAALFIPTDRYLYIRKIDIDNGNVVNTYGALFLDIHPYENPSFNLISSGYINSSNYEQYLQNKKAQIINFIRCAINGGTVDSLESLFSVALNLPYAEADGIIVDFNNTTTYIDYNGTTKAYLIKPKLKFQQRNKVIQAYEAIGECPVKFYSWSSNPARFVQTLLCNNGQNLFKLLSLQPNETPTSLYYDMPHLVYDPNTDNIYFDFGIMTKPSNAFDSTPNYLPPWTNEIYNFVSWNNPTLHPLIYTVFKNVIICEYSNSLINYNWLTSILEFFRPLHCKYLIENF